MADNLASPLKAPAGMEYGPTGNLQPISSPTGTPPSTTGTGGALPSASYVDPGTVASFLGTISDATRKQIQESQGLKGLVPSPDEATTEAARLRDIQKQSISSSYGAARDVVEAQAASGQQQLARFGEMLSIPDVQIKNRIQDFGSQVQLFTTNVNKTIERLTQEEQTALESQDMNYLQNVRQAKLDWINLNRQFMSDQMGVMTNAFNMLLTGSSFQRQQTLDAKNEASNNLTMMQTAYSGKKWDTIPDLDKQKILQNANVLGISEDMMKNIIQIPQVAHYISKPDAIYLFDKNGNILKTIGVGGGNSAQETLDYFKGYGGSLTGTAGTAAKQQVNDFSKTAIGSEVMSSRNYAVDAASVTASGGNSGLTYGNMDQWRSDRASETAAKIISSPSKVQALLGVPYSISRVTPDQAKAIQDLVQAQYDEWLPNTYLSQVISRAKNPMATMESPGTPQIQAPDTTQSDFGTGGGTSGFGTY